MAKTLKKTKAQLALVSMSKITDRLHKAVNSGGCRALVEEVRRWKRDHRYSEIRVVSVAVLGQRGLFREKHGGGSRGRGISRRKRS